MQKYHRGERRYQRHRHTQRIIRQEKQYLYDGNDRINERTVYLRVTTRKLCSCYLCTCDRRRWLGNSPLAWPKHDVKQLMAFQEWKRTPTLD